MISYIGTISVIVLNILCIMLRKKSKFITAISFAWMFIIFYGNTSNPDYSGYLWRYNAQTYYNSMEIGYTFLSRILYNNGLPYQYLVLGQILISLPFIVLIGRKINGNVHIFIVLYTLVFFTLDIIQTRNYVGAVIFTYAVVLLTENKKIPYVFTVILASLLHSSFLIYLPFVFLSIKTEFSKKAVRLISAFIVIVCVIAFANRSIILKPASQIAAVIMGESEKNVYLGTYINNGFVLYFAAIFINILTTSAISKRLTYIYNRRRVEDNKFSSVGFARMLYLICSLSCVFMPLLMLNTNFLRFIRNESICIILLISQYFTETHRKRKDYIPHLLVSLFAVLWFVSIGTGRYYQEILDNNFILNIGQAMGR